jgi:hypothetical protein
MFSLLAEVDEAVKARKERLISGEGVMKKA